MAKQISSEEKARRELFASTLSGAIAAKGMILDEISDKLAELGTPTSTATLSYWQNGRTVPTRGRSLEALRSLETVLDLPPGVLLELTGKGFVADWRAREVLDNHTLIEQTLAQWGLDLERHMTQLCVQDCWEVHEDRVTTTQTQRQILRVDSEVLRAFPIVARDGDTGIPPAVHSPLGGDFGHLLRDEQRGLLIGEFVLPRPLARGDLFWFEYAIDWAEVEAARGAVERVLALSVPTVTLDLRFRGGMPSGCKYHHDPVDGDEVTQELQMSDSGVQLVLDNAVAGSHQLHWEY